MKKRSALILAAAAVLAVFIGFMTYAYPFSPFSVSKQLAYKPGLLLYNDQTYEQLYNETKKRHEKRMARPEKNITIIRSETAFETFGSSWLFEENVIINRRQLEDIRSGLTGWRSSMLLLLTEENYTKEQRTYLVSNIEEALRMEEVLTQLENGSYYTRKEIKTLAENLRRAHQRAFEIYVSTFYERVLEDTADIT